MLMFRYLVILLIFASGRSYAYDPDYEMRVSWIKTLKELMLEIEKKEGHLLVEHEKTFLKKLSFIEEAWADSRYDCFYAGWPSVKNGKYCQNPARTNPAYDKSACKSDELQCNPLLFGKGLCVPVRTQEERNSSFSNCEKKFDGNYDFLKTPERKEIEDLRELSLLAHDICEKQDTVICRKVKNKIQDGLKSLNRAYDISVASERTVQRRQAPSVQSVTAVTQAPEHPVDCEDPEHQHEKLARQIEKVSALTLDDLYEKMKSDFQNSPFCDPLKIINDPNERPPGALVGRLINELREIDYLGNTRGPKDDFVKQLGDKWNLSPGLRSEILPLLNSLKPYPQENEQRLKISAQVKGLILQDFVKNYRPDDSMKEEAKKELIANNIFPESGECPFVSKDAFMKALKGRENVLKNRSGLNKNIITIVDYTRPSNERRMFVLDLSTNKVLHNTWVAHGGGGGTEAKGIDGKGSSPAMSNAPGSLKSSDGFVIATAAASGAKFGPNVLLSGIDMNNTNMARRAVVLHGWDSPMDSYTTGVSRYNFNTEKYDKPYDVIERIKNTDFRNSTTQQMEDSLWGIKVSTSASPYLQPTDGCLGVPTINMRHLDPKGRNKSQLEMLREDLPGSIIFNYSGPGMSSKYF